MPLPRFLNLFLDAPILRNERDILYLKLTLARVSEQDERLLSRSERVMFRTVRREFAEHDWQLMNPEDYRFVVRHFLRLAEPYPLAEVITVTSHLVGTADRALREWGLPHGILGEGDQSLSVPWEAQCYYGSANTLRRWVDEIQISRARGGIGPIKTVSHGVQIVGNEYCAFISLQDAQIAWMVSYEQVLMLKDMLWGRGNTYLAAAVIHRSSALTREVTWCFDWCLQCLERYGNDGYSILKELESISKIHVLHTVDRLLSVESIGGTTVELVREKERKLGEHNDFMIDLLNDHIAAQSDVQILVEYFGLQKLSGHPLLDPRQGGESVIHEARQKPSYDPTYVLRLRNNFCRMYVEGYVKRKREWPPLRFDGDSKSTRLYALYSRNETRLTSTSYPLSDWSHVRFKKDHEYNYFQNFTDLIDDRSLSYYRGDLCATWDKNLHARSHRRLLLELLARPETSVFDIVEKVRRGKIRWSWLVVTLYPKEREFKLTARMFSMMVFEMRLFFAACEANIADNVFPNLPQQTMTLSKAQIKELFHDTTRTATHPDTIRLFGEFDIERWNLHWFAEVVDMVGRDLSDMHGKPGMFTVVHHFFRLCAIIVRTSALRPSFIEMADITGADLQFFESSLMWLNHEPGFEGIFQKGWTCCTYPMIDLGMQPFGFNYYLVGQGDNQITMSYVDTSGVVDKKRYMSDLSRRIVESVADSCHKVGQSLKVNECVMSTAGVTYSKDVYLHGVEWYSSLKAFSRIFPNTSSDFPTVSHNLGAISSGCTAASERLKHPLRGYILWALHSVMYLIWIRDNKCAELNVMTPRDKARLTPAMMVAILLTPGILGGLDIATFLDFLYKGGADPLSKAYASVVLCQPFSKYARRLSHCLVSGAWSPSDPDLTGLLDDPFGIPLTTPRSAEDKILSRSKSRVFSVTKNIELKDIMSAECDVYESELRRALVEVRPLNPLLVSDVLTMSVAGFRRTIAKMFTSTRTIQALLQGDEDQNPCAQIMNSSTNELFHLLLRIQSLERVERTTESIYTDVVALRRLWITPDDVQLAGVTAYVPFEHKLRLDSVPPAGVGVRAGVVFNTGFEAGWQRGPETPYLGTETKERRSDHGYRIIVDSASDRAVAALARIMTQPGVGQSFKELIASVALTRANIDLLEVEPELSHDEGGSIDHRYGSLLGHRGAHGLGLNCFATNCLVSTDNADPLSGGADDYQVMLQESMVCAEACLQADSLFSSGKRYCCIDHSATVFVPLDESELIAPEIPRPYISLEGTNRLLYSDYVRLEATSDVRETAMVGQILPDLVGRSGPIFALRRLCSRALERAHTANLISDHLGGRITLGLDIQEVRGLGLTAVCQSCAHATAEYSCNRLFTRFRFTDRWAPIPSMTALSHGFALGLQKFVNHPLIRDDPLLDRLGGLDTLRYKVGSLSLTQKLSDYICRGAFKTLTSPHSALYSQPVVLFADEHRGIVPRLHLSLLRQALFRAHLLGEIHVDHLDHIARNFLPSLLRRDVTPRGKAGTVRLGCIVLRRWAAQNMCLSLTQTTDRMLGNAALLYYSRPATASLRESRSFLRGRVEWPLRARVSLPRYPNTLQLWTSERRGEAPAIGTPFAWDRSRFGIPYDLFNARRMYGRIYGFSSSVGYSYAVISELCTGRVCHIIGCGYGSGAAVLLEMGCNLVYGLDLTEDLVTRYSLSIPPSPPAVARRADASKFVRLDPSVIGSGDISEESTVASLLTGSGEGSVWIVDIPLKELHWTVSLISRLASSSTGIILLIRFLGTTIAASDLVSLTYSAGWLQEVREVARTDGYCEIWLAMCTSSLRSLEPTIPYLPPEGVYMATLPHDLTFLGGGEVYLRRSLLRYLTLGNEMDTAEITSSMWSFVEESIGDLEHRYSYEQWTELLHALVSHSILHSQSRRSQMIEVVQSETTCLDLAGRQLEVAVTRSLRRKLTRELSRLL